jgi:hypothetical protein
MFTSPQAMWFPGKKPSKFRTLVGEISEISENTWENSSAPAWKSI